MSTVLFQTMPPLSPDEYAQLEQSCLEHGIQVPILVDENGTVIDGHHRQKIAQEHGLYLPTETRDTLTDAEKTTLSISLNIDRRQLSREQRRAIIAASLRADPNLSDRGHAARTGSTHPTVAAVRREIGQVESFTTSSPDPEVVIHVSAETGEVIDEPTVTEHTVTEKVKTITGLDGKTYTKPERKPELKPVPTGDDAERVNAETMSKDLGRSLMSLSGMQYPEHRARLIERWLPAGNDSVPSDWKALIEPKTIREIAGWLIEFANDLEGSRA